MSHKNTTVRVAVLYFVATVVVTGDIFAGVGMLASWNTKPNGADRSDSIAIEIAERHVRALGSTERLRSEVNRNGRNEIIVTVWRLPETPGGFITIVLSSNGEITDAIPGH